jgi:hypothetical protein
MQQRLLRQRLRPIRRRLRRLEPGCHRPGLRIHKESQKRISPQCAVACAKAGSPLVILADSGTIYWPIADTTPASSQDDKLLPFAGQRVTVAGKVYTRGGSSAIVVEKITAETAK